MNDVFVEVTLAQDSDMGVFPVDTWFQESRFYYHVDPNFLVGFLDYRGGVRAFSEDFGAHFFSTVTLFKKFLQLSTVVTWERLGVC